MSPFISILLIPSSRCLYIRSSFNMNSFFFFKEVTFNLKDICLMNFFFVSIEDFGKRKCLKLLYSEMTIQRMKQKRRKIELFNHRLHCYNQNEHFEMKDNGEFD